MFSQMLDRLKHDTIIMLHKIQVHQQQDVAAVEQQRPAMHMEFHHDELAPAQVLNEVQEEELAATGTDDVQARPQPYVREVPKVGRNDPCPCGSGKKYKQCHGQLE